MKGTRLSVPETRLGEGEQDARDALARARHECLAETGESLEIGTDLADEVFPFPGGRREPFTRLAVVKEESDRLVGRARPAGRLEPRRSFLAENTAHTFEKHPTARAGAGEELVGTLFRRPQASRVARRKSPERFDPRALEKAERVCPKGQGMTRFAP